MNTREFARKHGKTTDWIRERCKERLIPLSGKRANGRWDIPEEAELPPCTGRFAAYLIENIAERENGRDVPLYNDSTEARAKVSIEYLLRWNFIAESGDGGYVLLDRGRQLMLRLRDRVESERTETTEARIGVEGGKASAFAGRKTEKKIV